MKTKIILVTSMLAFTFSIFSQKKIDFEKLPASSQEFLNTYFSSTPIIIATKDKENGEKGFEVKLKNGIYVEFWKDGSYREVNGGNKPIPTGFIPKSVLKYVTKRYPKEKITRIDYGHEDLEVNLTHNIVLKFTKDEMIKKGKRTE